MATPLTNMHYLGSQRGAMYSAEHNLERFHAENVARNRCNTPVKNLYISGMRTYWAESELFVFCDQSFSLVQKCVTITTMLLLYLLNI